MEDEANHRNGSYPRNFALKGIGEVTVKVPRDRKGEYRTQVIPKSKQYEDELRQDIAVIVPKWGKYTYSVDDFPSVNRP
ncbi:MAG: transposase [Dehalococcoidales bacterium]